MAVLLICQWKDLGFEERQEEEGEEGREAEVEVEGLSEKES